MPTLYASQPFLDGSKDVSEIRQASRRSLHHICVRIVRQAVLHVVEILLRDEFLEFLANTGLLLACLLALLSFGCGCHGCQAGGDGMIVARGFRRFGGADDPYDLYELEGV